MSEFILRQGAGQKLEFACNRNGTGTLEIEWLSEGENIKSVSLLARGEAELVLKLKPVSVPIDPIVRIDRSIRPVYPDFLNQEYINKPEFVKQEKEGPSEFDASRLRKWWHPKQKKGVVRGEIIHATLIKKNLIPSCLGYADLLGIQAKGIEFLRQHFKGQVVFGWRSVVPSRGGGLDVPYLALLGGVVLGWGRLGDDLDAASPALRFAP